MLPKDSEESAGSVACSIQTGSVSCKYKNLKRKYRELILHSYLQADEIFTLKSRLELAERDKCLLLDRLAASDVCDSTAAADERPGDDKKPAAGKALNKKRKRLDAQHKATQCEAFDGGRQCTARKLKLSGSRPALSFCWFHAPLDAASGFAWCAAAQCKIPVDGHRRTLCVWHSAAAAASGSGSISGPAVDLASSPSPSEPSC
eukprot:TRINITY_DN1252_c0_g1_i3.p2 TRINITY_DN1252_c0_g1~~TRINITY_DN1252_c0_g1_i3.p2  ORF type:complete len:204 (+),score=61.03 TRINITY_DN1252_c0_g1_i3:155-766(+)